MQGAAEALPFADDSCDLVTCQTVLIPRAGRGRGAGGDDPVTRPGGIVVACKAEQPGRVAEATTDSMAAPVSGCSR
ncbi:MAG: hypothetical protein IPN17_38125 [Deltaproteobacteria bacterium]|nr:hypothetical protein [Deltaproteobacteria bacterium]